MKTWKIHPRRKFKLLGFYGYCILTACASLLGLGSILWTLLSHGLPALHWRVFTATMPPPGQPGGLRNALFGSLIMTGLAMLIATPIGILIATFLVDFSGKKRLANIVRFINDILLSAPSIVVGLFVYVLIVKPLGHFSSLAGAIALALIALPMIVRSTEDVLYLVSPWLKEAAVAMGIARWRVSVKIVYRVAVSGIITGSLLALARIAGATAPLLFTALNNQFSSLNLLQPMANLPVTIFRYAMSPYSGWRNLAWAGAVIITLTVLSLNLLARSLIAGGKP